ncbi:helix-turn-helix domain-containing protein [Mucilaginibacter sp. SJ]|uniref:helix-turn-helix domain-containing protein n=1 Tax=Mucilaginibacter sp. SJ TaxID=3029053 RepID=UPI0023A96201|nr:helix-turn-helix transcriptional regulator [Mucilaginibacter sp. SJ]WEA01747.1 helix-turn-helix transcriptional regulator [Mucilaginibacter sp. SJ]
MDTIGEKIRIQRVVKKYSQEYMAFALEISQAAYSKIERGETKLKLDRIYEIAEVLEISPFKLMPPSKYDGAINFQGIYAQYFKIKRFIITKVLRRKYLVAVDDVDQSDISNN